MISDFRKDMISDSAHNEIQEIYEAAKLTFSEDIPFSIMKDGLSSDSYAIIYNKFYTKLNFALDYGTEGTTEVMSERERETWYDFIEYQDGRIAFTVKEEMVVIALDEAIMADIMGIDRVNDSLKSEEYLELMHSNEFTGFD